MQRVERATVVTHGVTRNVDEALARLRAVAERAGVELVDGDGSADATSRSASAATARCCAR